MPDFFRATATAMAKTSCCWIQRRTRTAMHLPCSAVSSMVAMVRSVDDSGEIAEEEVVRSATRSTTTTSVCMQFWILVGLCAVLDFGSWELEVGGVGSWSCEVSCVVSSSVLLPLHADSA